MAIHVGIGSWADDAYVGVLYPDGLPKAERLREYTRSFDHIEVNSTYYAIPQPAAVRSWVEQTSEPRGKCHLLNDTSAIACDGHGQSRFTFSVKLHRAFAQSPAKAAENEVLLPRLISATKPLVAAKRLSAFFLLLPPRFTPDRHRLEELDGLVGKLKGAPLAVELRDRAWVAGKQRETTLGYFRERKLVWVAVDMPRLEPLMPPVDVVTNPAQAYLRLHGRNERYLDAESAAEGHHYAYSAREITELAKRVRDLADQAESVYVIANNHAEDFAPKTALALKERLEEA